MTKNITVGIHNIRIDCARAVVYIGYGAHYQSPPQISTYIGRYSAANLYNLGRPVKSINTGFLQ